MIASEEELVEAVRAARADKRTLEIRGTGSKRGLGRATACDAVLELSALSGIVAYEPGELVLTARAGTPITEIAAAAAEHGQQLGFAPADWGPLYGAPADIGTLGSAVAADVAGSARIRFGAARDHVLGFRAVNGFGEIYKAGGKVVKNVTGFDLSKLMCGGFGTLGPLSEITVRLVPRPALSATFLVRDIAPEAGLALLRRLWAMPLEATGLAYVPACTLGRFAPLAACGEGAVLVRLDGGAAAIADKRALLQGLCEPRLAVETEAGEGLFHDIASGTPFAAAPFDLWRLAVPPGASAEIAAALSGTLWYADWAGALFWIAGDGEASAAALQRIALRHGGNLQAMRLRAPLRATLPAFSPLSEGQRRMSAAVKAAFDPDGMFNPGRLQEGL